MVRFLFILFFVTFTSCLSAATPPEWKEIADRIPYLNPDDVAYDRLDRDRDGLLTQEEQSAVLKLRKWAESMPSDELWELTNEPDAKIRTLALCSLYLQRNPKDLPRFLSFAKDEAKSYLGIYTSSAIRNPANSPAENRALANSKEQSVGTFAQSLVYTYLRASGYDWGIEGGKMKRVVSRHIGNREST